MNWADWSIVGILALSMLIALARGFVREALSLASWVVAIWVAVVFASDLAPHLTGVSEVPSIRLGVAFGALLVGTLIAGAVVNFLAGRLVDSTGLAGTDRLLGTIFGAARGVAIVAVLVYLGSLTVLAQDPWWQQSTLIAPFERVAVWMRGKLPEDLGRAIPG